jgi:hypothetical protein
MVRQAVAVMPRVGRRSLTYAAAAVTGCANSVKYRRSDAAFAMQS